MKDNITIIKVITVWLYFRLWIHAVVFCILMFAQMVGNRMVLYSKTVCWENFNWPKTKSHLHYQAKLKKKTPHFIIRDDGFGLIPNLMKPLSQNQLTVPQEIYNYRLSRAPYNCGTCVWTIGESVTSISFILPILFADFPIFDDFFMQLNRCVLHGFGCKQISAKTQRI